MSHFIASTEKVAAGTPETISTARKYLGCVLFPDGANAANVVVYKGAAAVAGNEIGAVRVPATESGEDTPAAPVALEPQGQIHVVVTGANAYALVRYST